MGTLLKNFSIKARISWAFGLVLLLFAGVSGSTTLSLFQAEDLFDDYREVAVLSGELMDMRGDFYSARVNAESFLRDGDNAALQRARAMLEESFEAYAEAREAVATAAFLTELDGLHAAVSEYQTLFERLVRENASGEAAIDQLEAIGAPASALITETAEAFDERRDAVGPVVNATLEAAERLAMWATAIGLVLGVLIAFFLARSIVTPVTGLTAAMKRVSDGDLTTDIPGLDRRDEVGAMASALAVFRDALQRNKEMEEEAKAREVEAEAQQRAALAKMADEFEATVGGLVRQLSSSSAELEATARSLSSNTGLGSSVGKKPGAMALQVIPWGAQASVIARVICTTPPLAAP